jgi:ATP-dependent Zn protease
VTQEQIPYSDFLQHLDKGEVKEATLSDQIVSGTLTQPDPKTHELRQFITQKPDDDAFAQLLAQHGGKFSVVHQTHWLIDLLRGWVLSSNDVPSG